MPEQTKLLLSFTLACAVTGNAYGETSPLVAPTKSPVENEFLACYNGEKTNSAEDTIECYEEVLRKDPHHVWAHNNLAGFYKKAKRSEDALKEFNEAIAAALPQKHAKIYSNRAELYDSMYKLDEAMADFKTALEVKTKDPHLTFRIAELYQDKSAYSQAIEWYTRCLELRPDDPAAFSNRGQMHMALLQYDKSRADFDRAIALKPNLWPTVLNRGILNFKEKRFEAALKDLNSASTMAPDHAVIYKEIARVNEALGDNAAALKAVEKALAIDPRYAAALEIKSRVLKLEDPSEAQKADSARKSIVGDKNFESEQRKRSTVLRGDVK